MKVLVLKKQYQPMLEIISFSCTPPLVRHDEMEVILIHKYFIISQLPSLYGLLLDNKSSPSQSGRGWIDIVSAGLLQSIQSASSHNLVLS